MADEERPPGEIRTVRQIGVWSFTKIAVLMGLLVGFMAIPVVAIGGIVGVTVSVGQVAILVVGLAFYGGFAAAIAAVVYNLAAEFSGGIKVRLE